MAVMISANEETWSRAICVSGVQLGRLVITTCQPGARQTTKAWSMLNVRGFNLSDSICFAVMGKYLTAYYTKLCVFPIVVQSGLGVV